MSYEDEVLRHAAAFAEFERDCERRNREVAGMTKADYGEAAILADKAIHGLRITLLNSGYGVPDFIVQACWDFGRFADGRTKPEKQVALNRVCRINQNVVTDDDLKKAFDECDARNNALRLRRYRCDRLTGKIAKDFADILREWFITEYGRDAGMKWEAMCNENRKAVRKFRASVFLGRNAPTCASHDFFDANVAMNEAMDKNGIPVFGKNGDEAITERVSEIWNKAWDHAKKRYLS